MVESIARVRHIRVTPQKARRVVALIKGKQAQEALAILKFAPQSASEPIYKLVASAIANARVKADKDERVPGRPGPVRRQRLRGRGDDAQAFPAPRPGSRVPDQEAHEPHHGRALDAGGR